MQAQRDLADAKGRYIAAISHDFGTPISMLRMLLAELEGDAKLNTLVGPRLSGMHAGLELLSTIRHKAVALNKIEHGQQLQPERASCSLRAILDDVERVAHSIPKKDAVRLETTVDETLAAQASRRWSPLAPVTPRVIGVCPRRTRSSPIAAGSL